MTNISMFILNQVVYSEKHAVTHHDKENVKTSKAHNAKTGIYFKIKGKIIRPLNSLEVNT